MSFGHAFAAAATTWVAASAFGILTAGTPFAPPVINVVRTTTIAVVTAGAAWTRCKFADGGGDDDCEEENPEECQPEETR